MNNYNEDRKMKTQYADKAAYIINHILPLEREGKIKVAHHESTVASLRKRGSVEWDPLLQAHVCYLR